MTARTIQWIGTVIAALVVALVTVVAVLLRLILSEAIRIYRRNAFTGSRYARPLWLSLGGFGVSLIVSLLMSLFSLTAPFAALPVGIGFVVWFVTIELVDLLAHHKTELGVEDVLEP